MKSRIGVLLVLAAIAVAVRLFALTFLHPLNWDEVEYFRATDWVRQGLVPFRDFWEHHTPLMWFVFAPFTALTDSPGAAAVIFMRWVQAPLWIIAFVLLNRMMKRAGVESVPRWTAIVLALTSSLLMISAMEYRVDTFANVLYLGGLLMLVRSRMPRDAFIGGALFCLAGLANLRLGPLLAVSAIFVAFVNFEERRWKSSAKALWLGLGVATTLAIAGVYFVVTDSLEPLYRHVWVENYIGEKYAERVPFAFAHRILIPFGVRIYGAGPPFQWSGIDLAGAAILVLGVIGLVRSLRGLRRPDFFAVLALMQLANIAFIVRMKFVYHYHLQIVVLLMIPFVAQSVGQTILSVRSARVLQAFVIVAAILSFIIVVFRGKELELRYQDEIMTAVHDRTVRGAKVFDGVGWALRRQPAYRFWFLPVLARELVEHGHAAPYSLTSWLVDPPAAVITDRNAVVWLATHRDLGAYVVRHYLPAYRNLLLPGLSAVVEPERGVEWIVPATGDYRVMASSRLAGHPWFRYPLAQRTDIDWSLRIERTGADLLRWTVDGAPRTGDALQLRRGSRVRAISTADRPIGVFLVPGVDDAWGRQPPPNVTIDGEGPREWHVPRLGWRHRPQVSGRSPTSSVTSSARDATPAGAIRPRKAPRCVG